MIRAAIPVFLFALVLPALAQPPSEQAIARGKSVYDQNCTACHGANGGAGEIGPAIVYSGTTTALRGERSDADILAVIRHGVPGTAMPAWTGKLSDEDIASIGAYIHSLRGTAIDSPLPGDPVAGQQVFWGKGGCGGCHMIGGRGGVIGPDLSNIASMRKSVAIANALTKPDHHVYGDGGVHLPMLPPMDENPVHLVKKDGTVIDGVMLNQDAYSVQVMGMDSKLHLLSRSQLRSVTIGAGSVMPSDYDKRLTPDEFRDLMAFLTRQGKPAATAAASRASD
jgi:putative heme-binding domain-containing protein